jgi:hypothetical protein
MRLSWNEIRARSARFADEWKGARYERGESQTFYNEFFEVFGVTRRRVASFEEPAKRLGTAQSYIDLFWKGVLLVEQKSAARRSAVPASIYRLERVQRWIGSLDFGRGRRISKFIPFDARRDGADRGRAGV